MICKYSRRALRQRAGEHREVLAAHEPEPSLDRAVAVPRRRPVAASHPCRSVDLCFDENVPLFERIGIAQQLERSRAVSLPWL